MVCAQQRDLKQEGLKFLAAGLAAAALLHGSPAQAGIEYVKPESRKVFIDDGSAAAVKKAAPAAAVAKKAPAASFQGEGGPDFKLFTLPLSLAAIAGGAVVVTKLDPGFAEMMKEAGAKDSRSFAGYETSLKDTPFYGGNGSIPSGSKGTTRKSIVTKPQVGTTSMKKGTGLKFFGK